MATDADTQPIVEFRGVGKTYGRTAILAGVNLTVDAGDFTVLYGPPASGKTVLLRCLLGLEHPTEGGIRLRGEDVTTRAAAERNVGYVPQSFALYPHLSVHDNIAYPLRLAGVGKRDVEPEVSQAAEMLKIADLLGKRPDQLSGGQKQRVAIARGIVKRTDLFVLDDPLAGLDFKLREQLFDDLRQMQQAWNVAFLYSTSDPIEAMTLAETIALLDGGSVQEVGPPERLYDVPQRTETMRLLGFPRANLLRGRITARPDGLWCSAGPFEFPVAAGHGSGTYWDGATIEVGIRPESIALEAADPSAGQLRAQAQVLLREDLGGEEIVYLETRAATLTSVVRHDALAAPLGDETVIGLDPRAAILFAPDGARIGQGATAAHG
ncbi:MAG: ABC transporter ATP-binding protein [Thermomicrobiales bacterium]